MWQVYVFNLVAALLIAGLYLRAVRRLEHRMDERMRKFEAWADAEDAKFATARDEIQASMREKADRAIAKSHMRPDLPKADAQPSANGHHEHNATPDASHTQPVQH